MEKTGQDTLAKPLLTREQAAALCSLHPRTLANYAVAGGGPRMVRIGRAVRYRQQDLQEWIDARLVRSTSERSEAEMEARR